MIKMTISEWIIILQFLMVIGLFVLGIILVSILISLGL